MNEQLVSIEVDGKRLQARKGAMLIEVTDAADIYVPRFCYHKKLSIAANCRMCLVEVEKALKPLPACATPVMEGMKVSTRSTRAQEAQKATMEFLLINHPLDCPICDQGGECELQDLAMGYGSDVSRYSEQKRVVKDKNIGPLIQTDMTRCIHCTRCVRFGDEIAGLRELGATGRSEHMEIGTYIEKAVTSEMSGNVIDLCPVGALTSKPYRYTARAWELRQREGIAPHDSIGSNLYIHIKGNIVKRVVPRENEGINEVWISDRDRYSYEGLYSDDRITVPWIKQHGRWREVEWDVAVKFAAAGLRNVLSAHGAEKIGTLASPTATIEELYLLQRVMRGIGCGNIDHRLRQSDFRDQAEAPLFPWLGQSVADLERVDAALLIGANTRKEHPIVHHRLRKASKHGVGIMAVNPVDHDFSFTLADKLIAPPSRMAAALAGIAKALPDGSGKRTARDGMRLLADAESGEAHEAVAQRLRAASVGTVLVGNWAVAHPSFSVLRALAGIIAERSGARLGYLAESGNTCGAWLAGVLPHRGPAGRPADRVGLDTLAMAAGGMKAYVLLGLEPELDSLRPRAVFGGIRQAEFVVSLTAYRTPLMDEYADVLLPISLFAETAGTYVNAAGEWQSFAQAVAPPGETRPAWKVLRVLGNVLELAGFEYAASEEVRDELSSQCRALVPDNAGRWLPLTNLGPASPEDGLELISEVPMHRLDALVRRAAALQQTPDAGDTAVHINPSLADSLGLKEKELVHLVQKDEVRVELPVAVDPRVPDTCVLVYSAHAATVGLEPGVGPVALRRRK